MRNACHWWLFTMLLVLILSIPAAAQTGPQQDSRIFRTEPIGSGYARTGVNTAIFRGSSLVTSELDNNLKCVDLSDLDGDLPLDVVRSTEILRRTEPWENDSLGYPTVVRNDHGEHPDRRYYLYYAHHDLGSGIGCAVAESIEDLT
ncbi:MAG TPA: hypothetical protein PLF81_12150 [Candidatus Anammoximicrobium sp.]|nr:hypothetical protein [Candidatus Anammoximicrobium sp.]